MQTRRIAINGIEVACSDAGTGAPPFVLVHGFTGHRDDFLARLPALAQRTRVLAPDLRGHGDATHTGLPDTHTFDQLVDDLRALLDALDVPTCDLLGHSLGGMVTLRFALAYPERLRSLVFMNTAPFAPGAYGTDAFVKAGAIAEAKGMVRLQELIERASRDRDDKLPSDRQTEKWGEFYWEHQRRRYAAMDPVTYGALGVEMATQDSQVPRLGEITCPTTVLVGDDDESFLDGADALEAGIPGAVRVTIPDAGHHPHMENPDPWLEAIFQHLDRAAQAG